MEVPFRHVLIVGAGLLGTSVALAVKRRAAYVHLTAIDVVANTHPPFDAYLAATDPVPPVDLAVLACPIDGYGAWMARFAREIPDALVTDIGSVKRRPHADADAAGLSARFAGGHPMAGGSRPGPERASASLFDGRVWFVTPGQAGAHAVTAATALGALCGGRIVTTDPDVHDATVAAISHLPQAVAAVLMSTVAEAASDAALAAAAGGLRDSTRIAEASAGMWQPIFAANADVLAPLLRDTATRLQALAARLDDPDTVQALFAAANAGRRRLPPL